MTGRTLLLVTALCVCTGIVHSQAPTLDALHTNAGEPRNAASASLKRHVGRVVQHGKVSWYGPGFAGRKTASGERFDPHALTMAHRSLPLGSIVEVTNDANGRQVRVRVNDRGPYRDGRVADLSRAASKRLGFTDDGVAEATLRVVALPNDALASAATQADAAPPG
jgi:rare lipoprotein A